MPSSINRSSLLRKIRVRLFHKPDQMLVHMAPERHHLGYRRPGNVPPPVPAVPFPGLYVIGIEEIGILLVVHGIRRSESPERERL